MSQEAFPGGIHEHIYHDIHPEKNAQHSAVHKGSVSSSSSPCILGSPFLAGFSQSHLLDSILALSHVQSPIT